MKKRALILFGMLFFHLAQSIEIVGTAPDGVPVAIYGSNHCREIPIGERRQISLPRDRSPTGIPALYTLSRIGKKNYSIELNIEFAAEENYDGDRGGVKDQSVLLDYHVDGIYRERVRKCFDQYKDKIKDPNDNIFNFHLAETRMGSHSLHKTSQIVVVGIADANQRSRSDSYASTINCPTIIHEVLHLLGLCDEYKEQNRSLLNDEEARAKGFDQTQAAAYDCRRIGEKNSIMNNQHLALESVGPHYEVTYAECSCLSKRCDATESVFYGPQCPTGYGSIEELTARVSGARLAKMEQGSGNSQQILLIIKKEVSLDAEATPSPVLNQEQGNIILFPECESINRLYYNCSQNAYRTSVERGGEGCVNHPACK